MKEAERKVNWFFDYTRAETSEIPCWQGTVVMYALVYGAREGKNDLHNILAGELHSKLSRGLVKHSIKENIVSVLYIGMKEHSCKEQLINC